MSIDYSVHGILTKDEKYDKMKKIADMCNEMGIQQKCK